MSQPWDVLPRVVLSSLPTPLVALERLSAAIGAEVWMKRDDVGSFSVAGNKVRKIEFLLGAALADGKDTLVTVGAPQSNSARAVAAVAAANGLRCLLVISGSPVPASANLLLSDLFGAEMRFTGTTEWGTLDTVTSRIVEELERSGANPVAWPVGCSNPLGTAAFVAAYDELLDQLDEAGVEPTLVATAASSGGTIAGLTLGHAPAGPAPRPLGFGVAPGIYPDVTGRYLELAAGAASLLGLDARISRDDVEPDWSQVGSGYGAPTQACIEAIRLLARTEGIVCDPVYTGKALAGVISRARAGTLEAPVVFWHTGGYHAVFEPRLSAALIAHRRAE